MKGFSYLFGFEPILAPMIATVVEPDPTLLPPGTAVEPELAPAEAGLHEESKVASKKGAGAGAGKEGEKGQFCSIVFQLL